MGYYKSMWRTPFVEAELHNREVRAKREAEKEAKEKAELDRQYNIKQQELELKRKELELKERELALKEKSMNDKIDKGIVFD